jgi:hypothetical protein
MSDKRMSPSYHSSLITHHLSLITYHLSLITHHFFCFGAAGFSGFGAGEGVGAGLGLTGAG